MKSRFSRRKFLAGAGVAIGLPYLESLDPRAQAAVACESRQRFIAGFVPCGINMPEFTPTTEGKTWTIAVHPVSSRTVAQQDHRVDGDRLRDDRAPRTSPRRPWVRNRRVPHHDGSPRQFYQSRSYQPRSANRHRYGGLWPAPAILAARGHGPRRRLRRSALLFPGVHLVGEGRHRAPEYCGPRRSRSTASSPDTSHRRLLAAPRLHPTRR